MSRQSEQNKVMYDVWQHGDEHDRERMNPVERYMALRFAQSIGDQATVDEIEADDHMRHEGRAA